MRTNGSKLRVLLMLLACYFAGCSGRSGQFATSQVSKQQGVDVSIPQTARAGRRVAKIDRSILILSSAAFAQAIHSTLPVGTKMYVVPALDIRDGSNIICVAAPIKKYHRRDGFDIVDRYGFKYHLSFQASITLNQSGITHYFRPGTSIPPEFASLVPSEVITGAVR